MTEELKDPEKITEGMKGGLARMYADEDIREYLVHAINIANHNVLASLEVDKPDVAKEYAIRLKTLKQLFEKGKALYNQAEKLKKIPLEELVKEKDAIN